MADDTKPKRFLTKRMVISAASFASCTAALWAGKMTDGVYVYAIAVILAGHHAADLIKAWRGGAQ